MAAVDSASPKSYAGETEDYRIPNDVDKQEYLRTRVIIGREQVANTAPPDLSAKYGRHGLSEDAVADAIERVQFVIKSASKEQISFDLIGVDTSIANALRRIMIAEVPTMAIERVFISTNTGVMQDEVLAHRIGLLPIDADPELFQDVEPGATLTDLNSLHFSLEVRCSKRAGVPQTAPRSERLINHEILTANIEWHPAGTQDGYVGDSTKTNLISDLHKNIVITKLVENQEINLHMYAVRGVGRDHAKWSPVGTATYRLLPDIKILRPVLDAEAEELQACFVPGVIGIRPTICGQHTEAYVQDARRDTVNREVFRHPNLQDAVALSRVRDHFIFQVESIGVIPSHTIVAKSLKILADKCEYLLECINKLNNDDKQ